MGKILGRFLKKGSKVEKKFEETLKFKRSL